MAIDGWKWYWSGDHSRGELLRDALENVQVTQAAQTRRLTSRLSELQGSLQSKLDALSTAFDAYVELGDVREQLRELPDWSHTRRAVQAALTSLMTGDHPVPLDPSEHDHWLADAMNAVVALVSGDDPGGPERRAEAKSDRAGLFIVATALALGAGERLDGRLARLFDGVSALDEDHVVLLKAATGGLTTPDELRALGEQLRRGLNDPVSWRVWLGVNQNAPSDHVRIEEFLATGERSAQRGRLSGDAGPGWQYESLEEQLSERAALLARSGTKAEAELHTRAGYLRARVEDPTGELRESTEERPLVPMVQSVLDHPDTPVESKRIIAGWLHEPLARILRDWLEQGPGPALTTTYTQDWSVPGSPYRRIRVEVTEAGADREELRRAERQIEAIEPEGGSPTIMFAGALAAAALAFVSLAAGGDWIVMAVVLLATAAGFAVAGIRRKRLVDRIAAAKPEAVRELRDGTRAEAESLRAKEAECREEGRSTTEAVESLLGNLGALSRQ
ncbi:MAG: hypothetical protein GX596_09070 [Propionibacterium sp.]|nr:hypothetical protein [Propionibacterium sp.]